MLKDLTQPRTASLPNHASGLLLPFAADSDEMQIRDARAQGRHQMSSEKISEAPRLNRTSFAEQA
jgi:hypothetical protein